MRFHCMAKHGSREWLGMTATERSPGLEKQEL
ncbi:MAG TPA: 5-formyltetrahydrofolate cyclo-ligase, partial [Ochrobactrum sp.]|nr:5-formyltetrahydrofolate cyclo-ligase [Ochrobactrum sp.]